MMPHGARHGGRARVSATTLGDLLGILVLLAVHSGAWACGWWGDAEHTGSASVQAVDASGRPVERPDPMQDPTLMVRYGDRFRTGEGAPRDLNLAHHWYALAADRGHPGGQYNLGLMYELGLGVARDDAEAIAWYRRAAEQGDVHAQHHLGRMLLAGRGAQADPASGLAWLERAARQGHDEVFLLVGDVYAEGRGVREDSASAYVWYVLAAGRGIVGATDRRDRVASSLDARELAAAETRARELAAGWSVTAGTRPHAD